MARPTKANSQLSRERILDTALMLLDNGGAASVSFRALGKSLGVTPMAVSHHVGTRQAMLELLVARVYAGVDQLPSAETPKARLLALLERYCERVITHPQLAQCVFADTSLYAGTLSQLTQLIGEQLAACGVPEKECDTLRDLIVDYSHGFAWSAASAGDGQAGPTLDDYRRGLGWLLDRL